MNVFEGKAVQCFNFEGNSLILFERRFQLSLPNRQLVLEQPRKQCSLTLLLNPFWRTLLLKRATLSSVEHCDMFDD